MRRQSTRPSGGPPPAWPPPAGRSSPPCFPPLRDPAAPPKPSSTPATSELAARKGNNSPIVPPVRLGEGEDLGAVVGDGDGVLDVGRQRSVGGDNAPAVGQRAGGR